MNRFALLALLLAGPALAQHDHSQPAAGPEVGAPQRPGSNPPLSREWTRLPMLAPAMSRGGERSAAALRPVGIDTAEVTVFAPGGAPDRLRVTYPVGPGGASIKSAAPMIGNYHWVTARQESDSEVRVASTAWYFANPGPAPTELLKQAKNELELVPAPLPREHSSYREAEEWRFQVRWNGAPLPNQKVTLETEFGSRSSYVSDAQGEVVALFPRDFRDQPARPGASEQSMGPKRAKFVVGTECEADGKRYLTAFNYTYSPDPARTRSLGWGAAFGVLGMLAALPLLRSRATTADFADSAEKKNA